ncbi:Dolichol kinase [Exaiptasia diaphana]|nr:Dolichol kinase [Exaiptasia diaphana]
MQSGGSLLTGLLLIPVFYYLSIVRNSAEEWIGHISFYLVLILAFFSFLLPWTYLMLGGVNPLSWLIHFITYTRTRYYLVGYWSCIVLLSIMIVVSKNWNNTQTTTVTRKYFHVLAIAVFLPGIMLESKLTHLAASVALAAFIFIEYVRLGRIEPFGDLIHHSLQVFLDEKDSGNVILTHVYLLFGCAIPIWLYPVYPERSSALAMYSGVLSLGVGDTLASLVGKKYGQNNWPGSNKTLEGTMAGLMAQFIFIGLLSRTGVVRVVNWVATALCVAACSLLEAWTSQIDNLVLPPFLYALIVVACR